ncbi:MAG: aspartate kinase, partial [Bacteroidota bacterium]|nr:aspartate kinase [Bacteroidota bacterium]
MQILKFGGSSVASPELINRVVEIVRGALQKDPQTVVVLSAMGGVTDALLEASHLASQGDSAYRDKLQAIEQRHLSAVKDLIPLDQQSSTLSFVKKRCNEIEDTCNGVFLLKELSDRTRDHVISYGELLSSQIVTAKIKSLGVPVTWKDSRELIVTNSDFGNAGVDFASTNSAISAFYDPRSLGLVILPGFISRDKAGNTTTLGRGGSDYTAAIVGAALHASVVEIWTDVSGMMTADPRLVTNARVIDQISYQEAMELSHFGAKVIYPPTLQPLMNLGIPVRIKNTFSPQDPGTFIHQD